MATAKDAKTSFSDQAARQYLDELDALMQRMLALPVNPPTDAEAGHPQEATATEPPSVREDPEQKTGRADSPAEPTGKLFLPAESDPTIDILQAGPRGVDPDQPLTSPAGEGERKQEAGPVAGPPRLGPPGTNAPGLARRFRATPAPYWLRPMLLINRAFDRCTGWFGPPGRWAQSQEGRSLLGWIGIALCGAAVTWAMLDWMGWSW
jgi:hypothetical protein